MCVCVCVCAPFMYIIINIKFEFFVYITACTMYNTHEQTTVGECYYSFCFIFFALP